MCDGELVALAGPFIEVGRRGDKVSNVDRFPDGRASLGIMYLASKLNCRIPKPDKRVRTQFFL